MKKSAVIIVASALIISCFSCSEKKLTADESKSVAENSTVQQETQQPDPYSLRTTQTDKSEKTLKTTTTGKSTSDNGSSTTTTTAKDENDNTQEDIPDSTQADPLGNGAFEYDSDGALQIDESFQTDDKQYMLISAGQALFESACRVQWIFTVGCPYAIDENSTVQNDFGWTYYRITEPNIKSFADVENDYNKVFSSRYKNEDLEILYIESGGAVYALNGKREINPYYSISKVTDIQSKTDDEIFFTVENYYEGKDTSPDVPYTEKETFSMVIEGNKIRVGQFRLPY